MRPPTPARRREASGGRHRGAAGARHGVRLAGLVRSALVPCAICLAGCGDRAASDSSDSIPRFRGEIELSIGEVAGADAYLFTRISGVARDEAGRIFVADQQTSEIRAFDPAGAYLFTVARRGAGPGEVSGPCCLALDPSGRLWVRDNDNARFVAFQPGDAGAELAVTLRMHHGGGNLWAPTTFDADGRLVAVGLRIDFERGPLPTIVRYHTTVDGAIADSALIPSPPQETVGFHTVERAGPPPSISFAWQPFPPGHHVAHGPAGGWAEAIGSTYRIELHHPGAEPVSITGPDLPGPELTPNERARAEEGLRQSRERLGVGSLPFGVPDRKPPLRSLFFDTEGRLWVELHVSENADRRADVYTGDGVLAGRYTWPAEVRVGLPGWTGRDVLLGVSTDSLGVERVVRVRFERAP